MSDDVKQFKDHSNGQDYLIRIGRCAKTGDLSAVFAAIYKTNGNEITSDIEFRVGLAGLEEAALGNSIGDKWETLAEAARDYAKGHLAGNFSIGNGQCHFLTIEKYKEEQQLIKQRFEKKG